MLGNTSRGFGVGNRVSKQQNHHSVLPQSSYILLETTERACLSFISQTKPLADATARVCLAAGGQQE